MTKEEFKRRWESGDDGGGITYDDIARCYTSWGLGSTPRIKPIHQVRYAVLKAAGTEDAEEFAPDAKPDLTISAQCETLKIRGLQSPTKERVDGNRIRVLHPR